MRQSRKTSSGHIALRTGSEGPSHDPYAFKEYEIDRDGLVATLHLGLGAWVKIGGTKELAASDHLDETRLDESQIVASFEKFAGVSLATFEKALNRHPHMTRKERRALDEIEAIDARMMRWAM